MRINTAVLALLVSALILVTITGCPAPEQEPPVTDPDPFAAEQDPAATDPFDAPAPAPTTEETSRALDRGVTTMSVGSAVSNIDGWITRLEAGEDVPQRERIVESLRALRTELQRSPLDGTRISQLLLELGDYTSRSGGQADNPAVQRMGDLLRSAGQRIRAGDVAPVGETGRPAQPMGVPGQTGTAGQPDGPDEDR
jgi:hypothetical protein